MAIRINREELPPEAGEAYTLYQQIVPMFEGVPLNVIMIMLINMTLRVMDQIPENDPARTGFAVTMYAIASTGAPGEDFEEHDVVSH